jgi:surface antigen
MVKVWWMMLPNRQRKSKKIHWLQDLVKSVIDDSIPSSMPEEQIPFPKNNYTYPEDYAHTPPLTRQAYTKYSTHSYNLQPPGTSQYPLLVSDPVYETRIATHDNVLLQSQLQFNDVPIKEIGCYRDAQVASPRQRERLSVTFTRAKINKMFALLSRRFVVHGALSILFIFIAAATFMAMVPLGYHKDLGAHMPFSFHAISVRKNDTVLIEGQVATATAVTVDGYDPGGEHAFAGVLTIPEAVHISAADYGSLSHFFYGQCTYWANMRYHQMTGHWIPWLGNAYQWAYQAPSYGWTLSTTPNPHGSSIMVFSPHAEGAGAYGHVAVVESVNSDGSVTTSNWNWGGAWATLEYRTFYPGPGVSFIWYPN